MTHDERIARALGICWHKWDRHGICEKCGLPENIRDLAYRSNPDFSTWPGFGLIMEIGPTRDWWLIFLDWVYDKAEYDYGKTTSGKIMPRDYFWDYFWDMYPVSYFGGSDKITIINPTGMRDTLSRWLKENEKEWRKG